MVHIKTDFFVDRFNLNLNLEFLDISSDIYWLNNDKVFPLFSISISPFLLDFRHADSVLQDELKQNGVPINQINESDGDEEYLGHDIKGM